MSAPKGKDLRAAVEATSELLEAIADDYEVLAELPFEVRQRFVIAAGRVARPGPWDKRALTRAAKRRQEAERKARDEAKREATGIRQSRRASVFTPWQHGAITDRRGHQGTKPNLLAEALAASPPLLEAGEELSEPIHCYICKEQFTRLHFFYDALCPRCAAFNWDKRTPEADLRGRVALVTGARVKIGFYAALMLLRAGARVVVATRFPHDAAGRYAAEDDFARWADRLELFGVDLRHTPSVEHFAQFLADHLDRLDFIINNACQTVRRPAGFYDHLLAGEAEPVAGPGRALLSAFEAMRAHAPSPLHAAAAATQVPLLGDDLGRDLKLFPAGQLDADGQQVDRREVNSWRLGLADVSAVELLEVQLVNAVAPFILNARLKSVMLRHPDRDRHIVNVSAMEGQFSRRLKTDRHPHTNMAKAALNMMTRTSAADYVRDGIHMNSVDTGWVTDEDPIALAERKTKDHGFHPPLDVVDGAARIVDPIFTGIRTGKHTWGAFLKDYRPTDW